MKLILEKGDLGWLQKNGYMGQEQVGIVWDQLAQKCNVVHEEGSTTSQSNNTKKELEIPNVEGIVLGEPKTNDLCIAFSLKNGENLARSLQERTAEKKKKVVLFSDTNSFDPLEVEKRIGSSTSLIVLLTEECLKQTEIVFALTVAKFYYQHPSLVILVHDAESCYFPSYDEQPESVRDFFSEKAITFLSCYPEEGVQEIVTKFNNEVHVLENILENFRQKPTDALFQFLAKNESRGQFPIKELRNRMKPFMTTEQLDEFEAMADKNKDGTLDPDELQDVLTEMKRNAEAKEDAPVVEVEEPSAEDLTTRVFLSHKRSTGQGIAGRFYEGLKKSYKVFIDSEAKFKIHNLKLIVQNTDVLVFILTYGILLSKWCLEELKAAIANKKKVIVVRELSFKYPDELPEEWKEVEPILKNSKELIWIAEYNSACVNALHNFIGSPDERFRPAVKYFTTREGKATLNAILHKFQSSHILDLNRTIPIPSSVQVDAVLDFVLESIPAHEIKVAHITTHEAFENAHSILSGIFARLPYLQDISLAGSGDVVTNDAVKDLCNRFPRLHKLDLEQCIELTSEALSYIKGLEHLTELNLGKISGIKDEGMEQLASGCPKLEVLKIGFGELTHKSFAHVSKFANLKELEFPYRLKTHEDAKKYLEEHPNVKVHMQPIIVDCRDYSGNWYPAIVKSYTATQTGVHFYGTNDYSDDVLNKNQWHERTAEYGSHKEEYGYQDDSHSTSECHMCDTLHADLQHVKFSGSPNKHFINDWYFQEEAGITFLNDYIESAKKGFVCYNLYSLPTGVKFTSLLKALSATVPLETVTELVLEYGNSEDTVNSIKAMPHLKCLWLQAYLTELTEIQPLADALPPIEELRWVTASNDTCFEHLGPKLPSLKTLCLVQGADISEKGLLPFFPEGNKLENVTLKNFKKLNPELLKTIAERCKNVHTLNLTLNELLVSEPEETIVHLIKGFPALKKLVIDLPLARSAKFAEFKDARPGVEVDDSSYFKDAADIYNNNFFYPSIEVSETKHSVTYHLYGTGRENQFNLKDDEAKLKPLFSNSSAYGPQDSHCSYDCFYCSLLHPLCEKIQFQNQPNKFFQNDWYFEGEEGKTLVTKFVPQGPENRIVFDIPLPDGIQEWAIVRALAQTADPEKSFIINCPNSINNLGKLLTQPLNITGLELGKDCYLWADGLTAVFTKRPTLTRLVFEAANVSADQEIEKAWLKFNFPDLQYLDLTGTQVADNLIEGIAKSTKLVHLNLGGTALTDKSIEVLAKNWTNLTTLCLRRLQITERSIEAICQNCQNLQSLNLVLCTKLPATVCKLIQEGLPNLKELRVPYHWVHADMLSQLKSARPEISVLEKTEFTDAYDGTSWYPAVILDETAKSYYIHFYGQEDHTNTWILKTDSKTLAPLFTNKDKYGKQRETHFSNDKCQWCETLHPMCEHFKFGSSRNLAFINDWFFDSHEGKVFMNQLSTQVKTSGKLDLSLNLPAGLSFEKTAIAALDTIPADIISHISFPKPVSTETLEHMLQDKTSLLTLSLIGGFTDAHATIIADKCSDSLTTLSLFDCTITDEGLIAIANRNHILESVTVKHCKHVTDKGIEAIVVSNPNLYAVDIDLQYQPLTGASVRLLAKVPSLASASISYKYTQKEVDEDMAFLKKKKPHANINRGLVLFDCVDRSSSWYPAVATQYNETEKKMFVHFYGWGSDYEEWLDVDNAEKIAEVFTHTSDYGSLYSTHFKEGCTICNQIHQYCRTSTFSGQKLSYYLN